MGRSLGFVSVLVVMGVGMYFYSSQLKTSASPGGATSPAGAVNITGVRSDLLSIAGAERRYYATEGKYASLDELVSANYLTMRGERPPYTYDIQTTSTGFRAIATRSGPGSPAQVWIDETMTVQTSD
jgi:hypothetical protein